MNNLFELLKSIGRNFLNMIGLLLVAGTMIIIGVSLIAVPVVAFEAGYFWNGIGIILCECLLAGIFIGWNERYG